MKVCGTGISRRGKRCHRRYTVVMDELWLKMFSQLTFERLQEVTFAGVNGKVLLGLSEAEQFFYDRGVEEARLKPGAVWDPVDP